MNRARFVIVLLLGILLVSGFASCELLPSSGTIVIRYSDAITDTITDKFGLLHTPDPGFIFLVLDLDIENQGYKGYGYLFVSTNHFSVVVSNADYYSTYVVLEDKLEYEELQDGERVTGKVVFEVPQEVMSVGYQPKYKYESAPWEYNTEWIKQ